MEYREKLEVLRKYRSAVKLAKYYQDEVKQYRATQEQAAVQKIDDMPHAHGNHSDLSDYIVKLEEMTGKMYTQLIKAQSIRDNIFMWCESLTNVDERLILRYAFIQDHKTGWIADEMHYSERTVRRKLRKAIEHLPDPDFEVVL